MEIIGFKTLVLVNFLYLTCRKPRKHQSPNKTIFNNPAPAGPGSDSRTHTKAKDTIFKNVEKKINGRNHETSFRKDKTLLLRGLFDFIHHKKIET